jgi:hypothetical protein
MSLVVNRLTLQPSTPPIPIAPRPVNEMRMDDEWRRGNIIFAALRKKLIDKSLLLADDGTIHARDSYYDYNNNIMSVQLADIIHDDDDDDSKNKQQQQQQQQQDDVLRNGKF